MIVDLIAAVVVAAAGSCAGSVVRAERARTRGRAPTSPDLYSQAEMEAWK